MIKKILSMIMVIFLIGILILYWIVPQNKNLFLPDFNTTNFVVNDSNSSMQFYSNMRYEDKQITYNIEKCPVDRKQEMLSAMNLLSSKTILEFKETKIKPEIEILCEDKVIETEYGMFIAGEGGPTNVTLLEDKALITQGKVLLLKASKCKTPDIALHELLHALGFIHSSNPKNIMYPVSYCNQELSEDIIDLINELYSISSLPDLKIENANAEMKNRYLNLNVTIRNIGFKKSMNFTLNLYINNKLQEEIKYDNLEAGFGKTIMLTNIFITTLKVEEIRLEIIHDNSELKKDNNILILK